MAGRSTEKARRRRAAQRVWSREPIEVRRMTCDGCGKGHLLAELRCNDQFTGLYCGACLPVAGGVYPPGATS